MAKRKRDVDGREGPLKAPRTRKEQPSRQTPPQGKSREAANLPAHGHLNGNGTPRPGTTVSTAAAGDDETTTTVQVITGSYERVLHGFTAALSRRLVTGPGGSRDASKQTEEPEVPFSDTFLFNAHGSAIRCLALSPLSNDSHKVALATGGTDERINVYSLSTAPPVPSKSKLQLPTLHGNPVAENSRNRELGNLMHHSSSITALCFPTRAKLLSSAEDSTIAVTRTRDWQLLETIKAPIPKPQGRPSGDTAAPGEVPSGVNDFAVHPSMKLMLSVGKGEKCMRLWNLVTGKKAGVLNFGREILSAVGEGRFGSGEGRRVGWDQEGEEYAVAFERGAIIFGIDSKPNAKLVPTPRTKLHQLRYLPTEKSNILVVSTEDGRIVFYDTAPNPTSENAKEEIPSCTHIAQLGGPAAGITGRIKDFQILPLGDAFIIVTGSSDGTVRIWSVQLGDLDTPSESSQGDEGFAAKQVGNLIAINSTNSRITCLEAFIMTGKAEEIESEEEEAVAANSEESSSDDDSD